MNTISFKRELESILMITNWSPTEKELIEIAKFLSESEKELSKNDVKKIIYDVIGSYEFIDSIGLEGVDNSDLTLLSVDNSDLTPLSVDNSDLTTLLRLATKTVSDNDK